MATLKNQDQSYSASDIQVLEGMEAVRRRPGMYIGSTDQRGVHQLIYEAVDNSVDEFMAGYCTSVKVEIDNEGVVVVEDDGRGIPVDVHKRTKVSGVETVMTTLHAGGKFDSKAYQVSGGLHGVGISVVNALSSFLNVDVYRDSKHYEQTFSRGKTTSDLSDKDLESGEKKTTGTRVSFKPDTEIFPDLNYDFGILSQRFKEIAYLNKGLKISFKSNWGVVELIEEDDEMLDDDDLSEDQQMNLFENKESNQDVAKNKMREVEYFFEGGISQFVVDMNASRVALHEAPVYVEKEIEGTIVEVALQYNDGFSESVYAFANCVNNADGGTHITGFRAALTRVMNDSGRKYGLLKTADPNLSGEDVREGLAAVISVKLTEPQFEGQTKRKLGNPEVRAQVEGVLGEALQIFLEDNPIDAKRILDKCLTAQRARDAARKARELIIRKNAMDGGALPGKLADCSDKNPENCEIYIVEGDSAGGTAKMGRERSNQAILPLRGKVLNVEKAREDKMLAHQEIRALIIALGAGLGDEFDCSKLRYNRVIIMTDADVDGSHIRTLLLTFFFRHMYPLISEGHLYIAQPPLYRISKGRKQEWAYSDSHKDELLEQFNDDSRINVQRYKGLGEMSAEQLWETTMNPEDRSLLQVNQEDAMEADNVFSMLMGDVVEPRRNFIQENALEVKNLDV
tara:strand:+ start:17707 stop:19752 length:2046 start_codon:yes stop_codon:yes gene_type:complete